MLWQLLREVSLSAEEEDQNLWKWMSNGEYTASSAYSVQFQGSHPPFRSKKLWKARTEPKVKIFAWTMMHQKILTADNLEIRGMQHDPLCLLCNSEPEDAKHLFIKCIFTKEVYRLIWLWFRIKGNATPCLPCQELAGLSKTSFGQALETVGRWPESFFTPVGMCGKSTINVFWTACTTRSSKLPSQQKMK
jgi:hypothetical protein